MYLLNIIFSEAHAQAVSAGPQSLEIMSFVAPLAILFVPFYFLIIRPQTKKAKEHREMLGALRRGDQVVTSGGVIGTITKIENDNELIVEIANNVNVRVVRSMVTHILTKTQPVTIKESPKSENSAKPKKPTVAGLKSNKPKILAKKPALKKGKK